MKTLRNIFCFLAIALVFSALQVNAQTASEFFMLGNNAYKVGDYKKAVECYESAIKQDLDTAEVRYNLANALAKLDKKGEALLNYRRAVFLSPRMREASANLQMFAKDNSLDDGLNVFSTPLIAELSEAEWATVGFVVFWGAVLTFFIPPLFNYKSIATTFISVLLITIFALSIFSILNWRVYANTAIAIKADVPLRLSPTPDAPISAIVAEGQTATIDATHGNFIYVETPNGKKGWTAKTDFVPVVE